MQNHRGSSVNEENESWYDWGDENRCSGLRCFEMGIDVHSIEDLDSLHLMFDSQNPFNDADPYDIFC